MESAKKLPSSSSFSFKAPFPSSAATSSVSSALKQRRVSLALPSSPRLVPAWSFRDDTGIESHATKSSSLVPEKRGKMRKIAGDEQQGGVELAAPTEKKQRKKWTLEETQMLVDGCNKHGVGNWKAILSDPGLVFDSRSPVDLKDRFRTYFPDAYKQHYPNAKTHLSTKVRSTLPDGSPLFEKTRSKKRRPFTEEEDHALKAGYERHGTVWATIVKDPIFQEQNRRSTDLRDRFRNAFPELYQAAGYKPRSSSKLKKGARMPLRAATDDQLTMSTAKASVRRRRRANTDRGGTKSVPESTTCSEDEDSSGGEEEGEKTTKLVATFADTSPLPTAADELITDMEMDHIPDFLPNVADTTEELNRAWSSGLDTPIHSNSWSANAGSPTSPHLSTDFLLSQSSFQRRGDGLGMIGKSAWGTEDWFSANPRLDPSASLSSSSSFADSMSPAAPSSPFSFHHLNHGVFDRYDLFPTAFAHDFASEVGASDSRSTFSEEMFPPNGFRGFTHHSNYAGDLIFGARTHQPTSQGYYGSGFGFGVGPGNGLGLSNVSQSASVHPSQLHTPALAGIDEIELTGISLNDQPEDHPMQSAVAAIAEVSSSSSVVSPSAVLASAHKDNVSSSLLLQDTDALGLGFGLGSIEDLIAESVEFPASLPATPITRPRLLRTNSASGNSGTNNLTGDVHSNAATYMSGHGRSFSVPPPEARMIRPSQVQTNSQPILATSVGVDSGTRSLEQFFETLSGDSHLHQPHHFTAPLGEDGLGGLGDSDTMRHAQDPYGLPFLDLHYYGGSGIGSFLGIADGVAGGVGGGITSGGAKGDADTSRQELALDLAQPQVGRSLKASSGWNISYPSLGRSVSANAPVTVSQVLGGQRPQTQHHRVQSALAPGDLLGCKSESGDGGGFGNQAGSGNDCNKRKRASWDGGAT